MQTGQRNEGMYYSLVTLAQKIASSVAVPLALLVLNAMDYVSSSAIQPESAINGIRIVAGPIPALIMFVGILFAIFYPLECESYTEIAQQLEAQRKTKTAQTDDDILPATVTVNGASTLPPS
jgi:glycoside/pentoside/hexuronide:cation symporter, GPH family